MGMAAATEHRFHVLAVDDSLIDRKLVERLLKTSSYQVTTVDSGSKALEFLGFIEEEEQSSPNQPSVSPNSENHREQRQILLSPTKKDVEVNLVITDYCMPGMTGYDLLRKIKESSSLRNIPVVIMSSENVPSRISRCLEDGAEEFFLKPVQLSDVNKLKPHMQRAKYGHNNIKMDQQVKPHEQMHDLQRTELITAAELPPQKVAQQQLSNNKRKSMIETSTGQVGIDEGISHDRTRPRYSGLAVV